ncbi:MAG: penicillin-binding protein 2 [Lentisphaerae bacterium]|nr:penicillin-binding protein 2 [Lentisphaerota bacterium]
MALSDTRESELLRVKVTAGVMLLALGVLAAVLWRVQVARAPDYRSSLYRQSVRRVRLPAIRGAIRDRYGRMLADNRPSYCIAVYVEELRRPGRIERTIDAVEDVIRSVSGIVNLPREVDRDEIERHIRMRRPLPLLIWKDIGPAALARWCESDVHLAGVDIYVEPVRAYPHGALASHVLGYVGRAEPANGEAGGAYHYYLPEMEGKYGVEKTYNAVLAGEAGGRLLRVDASGFKHGEIGEREPAAGRDLFLTLDVRIQRLLEETLGDIRGAAVVLDPRNGDVLALASRPDFDPSDFSPAIAPDAWRRLTTDPGQPFFNRAITGTYAPGSTFKPVVSLAALENDRAGGDTVFGCPGYFEVGGVRFHCWRRSGHGKLAMREALEQSCNAYFCQLGLQCGYERIYHMAEALGLGRETGIDLPSEAAGLLPNSAWKERYRGDSWRAGDTCNASIGQGALAFTPVQMAMFAATLANGGTVYRPRVRLVPGRAGDVCNVMHWAPETLAVVRGGMRDVVMAPHGTGRRAYVEGVVMAGKTGTAEHGPREARRKYGWMILFAPYEAPRFAVAMVVEDAVSGGTTVAPRLHALMEGIFGDESGPVQEGRG